MLALQVLFYPGYAPPESVLWEWGWLSISSTAPHAASILARRVLILDYATTMVMLTTPLVDLTDGLEHLFSPLQKLHVPVNEVVLVAVIAIKFVPVFIEEPERLARTRTTRGIALDDAGVLIRA